MRVRKTMNVAERLIVAADFSAKECGFRSGVEHDLLQFVTTLRGTGVAIKANSALRSIGYGLVSIFRGMNLLTMADLKLIDIPETMKFDGELLEDVKPAFVTAMAQAGRKGIRALRDALHPDTKLLAVTILTTFDGLDWKQMHCESFSLSDGLRNLVTEAFEGGADGLVCSGRDLTSILARSDVRFNYYVTPGIRPTWSVVKDDDQKRITTPADAIRNGATHLVIGRPITGAKPNTEGKPQSPREAVEWTLREIEEALKG